VSKVSLPTADPRRHKLTAEFYLPISCKSEDSYVTFVAFPASYDSFLLGSLGGNQCSLGGQVSESAPVVMLTFLLVRSLQHTANSVRRMLGDAPASVGPWNSTPLLTLNAQRLIHHLHFILQPTPVTKYFSTSLFRLSQFHISCMSVTDHCSFPCRFSKSGFGLSQGARLEMKPINIMQTFPGDRHLRTPKACGNMCTNAVLGDKQIHIAQAHEMMVII
jgi:hypothetical protein